jgi:uncharacterized protein YndB with AHSA1/START domain
MAEAVSPDHEIVSTRTVNAPIDKVFRAWTEPEHLQIWWGPAGFSNTFEIFDLRPGGTWKFIMHGPEKGHYPNECEFTRIEKPTLLAWKRRSKPLFSVLVTFEETASDQTRIIFKQIFSTAEECSKLKPFVPEKNEENFDRLEKVLENMT